LTEEMRRRRTSQPVDGPLLELLESDIRRGRRAVEVQPVRVGVFLPLGSAELLFAVVEDVATLALDAACVCTDHLGGSAAAIS
jgi:hypothetical protein